MPFIEFFRENAGRVKTPWRAIAIGCLVHSMKSIQKYLVRSILVAVFIAVGAGRSMAYDHDSSGWFDEHHQHHAFIQNNGHRGYWDHDKSGAKVFISI